MSERSAVKISIGGEGGRSVSGLLVLPPKARLCLVFAHGAGAGMTHPFMETIAAELSGRQIATLRYQFPYMEEGGRRPDPPNLAQATVRAAVAKARELAPKLPLIAGGKSFGGRMTSQAEASSPLEGVRALVFFGFPLHPAGKPSNERARHLFDVRIPMLFLHGGRDSLADEKLLRDVVGKLGPRAVLASFPDADHSFHVPARSGMTDAELRTRMLDELERFTKLMNAASG